MDHYDYFIVGAGFAGSTIAQKLASDYHKRVLVIDRRDHVGGNSYDYYDDHGVLIHKYGPHYFRTNSKKVFDFLSRFTEWRFYEYRVKAYVNKKLYSIPINRDTINQFFDIELHTAEEVKSFLDAKRVKIDVIKNSEDQVVSEVGWEIYESFFKNYTKKQWGVGPKELDKSVCARIPIRTNTDDRYFTDTYQAMPRDGYHVLFKNLLDHPYITVARNTDFSDINNKVSYKKLIYTGCIDEFFEYTFGRLPYRSLRFCHEHYNKEYYQDWSQINYPNDYEYTRIVEIKHATGQICPHTTVVKEFPLSEGEPYYPIPCPANHRLYTIYRKEAEKLKDVIFIGRLAQYNYLNMDQVVEQTLHLCEILAVE